MGQDNILVSICCIAFNQAPYIRQCLDGFIMQKTNFRYEIIINDDCSTDGTTEIIKEYAENYPDIIKPILHDENQWSKGVRRILATFIIPKTNGKYIALCEGDDYWIDPNKLQRQVDFLETNPKYSMCCSEAIIETTNGTEDWTRHKENTLLSPEEVILGGGLYIQTATLLYRKSLLEGYPEYCLKCHVGDYPLKIWGAINGGLYYFSDKMAAYRFQTVGSWTSQINNTPIEKLIQNWRSEIEMLKGLDVYSNGKYTNSFRRREANYIFWAMRNHKEHWKTISHEFSDIKSSMTIKQRIADFVMTHNLTWLYNCLARFQ